MKEPESNWLQPALYILPQDDTDPIALRALEKLPLKLTQITLKEQLATFPQYAALESNIVELMTSTNHGRYYQFIEVNTSLPYLLRITDGPSGELEVYKLDYRHRVGWLPFSFRSEQNTLFITDFTAKTYGGKKLGTYLLVLLHQLAAHTFPGATITGKLSEAVDDVERLKHFYQRRGFTLHEQDDELTIEKQV